MDDTIRKMVSQLRSNLYYNRINEEIEPTKPQNTSDDSRRTFSSDDSVLVDFIDDIQSLIETTPITFNELNYFPNIKKVKWSGTVGSGLEWAAELGGDGKGFFITADNVKYNLEETRALLKLHAYFDSSWVSAIRDAIKNKDLSKKKE